MLTIVVSIIGTVVFILLILGILIFFDCKNLLIPTYLTVAAILIGLGGCCYGIFGAKEYTDWEIVDEIELVSLSNSMQSGGTGVIYISITSENVYWYRYQIDSEFGTETSKEYDTKTLTGNNITEVEDKNCKKAVLRIYERKGIPTIWNMAVWNTETHYVFYVPEGTIQKEIKLS